MINVILFIVALSGGLLTFYSTEFFKWSAVRSSSFWSLLVGLICFIFADNLPNTIAEFAPLLFIGSTFVGMVSKQQLNGFLGILAACFIYAILATRPNAVFAGYGGLLGTTACVSLLITLNSRYLKSHRKLQVGWRKLNGKSLKRKRIK